MTAASKRWRSLHLGFRRALLGLTAAGLMVGAGQAAAAGEPGEWLERMGRAMQELSYSGTFVYLHDNQIEAMRIVHTHDEQGERERLVSLNGEAREVIRDKNTVTCILPGSRSVNVTKARARNPLPVDLSSDLAGLQTQYRLSFDGEERVAGMQSRIIAVTPQDRFRYGYRLWIDRENYLLVRSEMTDAEGRAVEQVMFTDLQIIDSVPDEYFKPVLAGSGYTWKRADSESYDATENRSEWLVSSLPPGFRLTALNRKSVANGDPATVEHLVYSDGMATLSVFIEPQDSLPALNGESRMGAVNAFGRSFEGYHVTVVGEVPIETLRLVGDSVSLRR